MIYSGYDGARRLIEIQEELLERNETLDPRAEVELIKTMSLCNLEGHLLQLLQQRLGDRRTW